MRFQQRRLAFHKFCMTTLLLADDQALVRGALAALLGLEEDLEVVADVGSGHEVLEAALRTRPDVAVLDVEMPGMDGIAATAQLVEQIPGIRVLIVTTFGCSLQHLVHQMPVERSCQRVLKIVSLHLHQRSILRILKLF